MARRIMPKLVTLVILIGVSCILGASVLLASLYAAYLALEQQGLGALHALLATIGIAMTLMLGCLLGVRWRLHHLHDQGLPPADKIASVIDAFIEGFHKPDVK